MTTTVRPARPEDMIWLLDQLEKADESFALKLLPIPEIAAERIGCLIAEHVVFISERGTERTGFIAGILHPHFYNPSVTVLTQLLWWVQPAHRYSRASSLLFKAFTDVGERVADWLVMTLSHRADINERSLTSRGFVLQERSFLRLNPNRTPNDVNNTKNDRNTLLTNSGASEDG